MGRPNQDHLPLYVVVNLTQDILDESPFFRAAPDGVALVIKPLQGLDNDLGMGNRYRPPCTNSLHSGLSSSAGCIVAETQLVS